jgi:hypothetical protein
MEMEIFDLEYGVLESPRSPAGGYHGQDLAA